jgi:pimeloyl-ACP methyl ester carboxylesterase
MGPNAATWIAEGARVPLLGRSIFVKAALDPGRPLLLLIHGYPTASYDWHLLWAPLAARFSLLTCDLLGFGMSDKPRAPVYSIARQADVCQAVVAHFGGGAVHVLAHDYGDTVAQELVARASAGRAELSSVIFLNGGLFPENHRPRPIQRLLATPVLGPLVARFSSSRRFATTMRAIAGANPPPATVLADLWTLVERDHGREALARLIGYMAERRRERDRWVGGLVRAGIPLRLICGAMDPISGSHMAARYAELVPSADVVLLEGVGHYPQLEASAEVLAAVHAFHDRIGTPRAFT